MRHRSGARLGDPRRDRHAALRPPRRGPCPPPYAQKVPGERVLHEQVVLLKDGTAEAQRLVWLTVNPNPTVIPYCGRRPEGFAVARDGAERAAGDATAMLAHMVALEAAW